MKGWTHAAVGVGLGVGLASLEQQGLRGGLDEIALCTLAALGPDVDRRTSLLGRLIPDRLWPSVETLNEYGDVRSSRRLWLFNVEHHGPTHSVFVGLLLGLPWWLVGHREFAVAWGLGWLVGHLLMDGYSLQQLLWPLSGRWIRLWPRVLWTSATEQLAQALALVVVLAGLTGRLHP